jgi:hypothetical protein
MEAVRQALALLLLLASGPVAWADDPFASVDRARALYARGRDAYTAGRYLEAAQAFHEAYEIESRPALLYNEAQAWRGEYERTRIRATAMKAISLYEQYLASPKTQLEDARSAAETLAVLGRAIAEQPAEVRVVTRSPRRVGLWVGIGLGTGAIVALALGLGLGFGLPRPVEGPVVTPQW